MSFLSKIFNKGPKPIIAHSKDGNLATLKAQRAGPASPGAVKKPDLNTSESYLLNKTVKMTRDIRPPKPSEEVFGKTVWGIELSKEAVTDLIRDTVLESLKKCQVDKDEDLDFVVRSTGVTAGFATAEEAGQLIIALADGCLAHSLLENIMFDGAVVSVVPPKGKETVANEMEGELVTAGIKLGAKWTEVDYRNPCVSLDFGSTLAGRIVNDNEPYANTVGNFLGLAGVVSDSLARGSGQIDKKNGAALDLYDEKAMKKANHKKAEANALEAHKLIDIRKVPMDVQRFGTVPVNPVAADNAGTTLIGCDVGVNGDKLPELMELGAQFYDADGLPTLLSTLDYVSTNIVKRVLDVAFEENVIVPGSALGITGRAGITGRKPELILQAVQDKFENVVFVEDGLALGSAIMARCMNSMGTPKFPIGGKQGGRCILKDRMKMAGGKFA